MLTYRSLKLIDNHAEASTPRTDGSATVIDISRARLPFLKSAEHSKNCKRQMGLRMTAAWLMFLAEVILLAMGVFYVAKLGKMRETESEHLRSAAEGIPAQGAVTIDEALQAFSARH
jgi:hypothetical protein